MAGLPSFGTLSLAALGVCVLSGIVVLSAYEPARPLRSILAFELERPYGAFFRALHAWSSDLFLVALVLHTIEHLARRADRDRSRPWATWAALVLSLPVALYLVVGGHALTGDAEGGGVRAVLRGIFGLTPFVGPLLADVFAGSAEAPDTHAILTHHVSTATLAIVAITVVHVRRLGTELGAFATALGVSGLLALARRPALGPAEATGRLHGPWPLGGLRVMLEHAPAWLAGQVVPGTVLVLILILPKLSDRTAARARVALAIAAGAYALLGVWAALR